MSKVKRRAPLTSLVAPHKTCRCQTRRLGVKERQPMHRILQVRSVRLQSLLGAPCILASMHFYFAACALACSLAAEVVECVY